MSDTPATPLYDLPNPHGSDVSHVRAVGPGKPLAYVTYESIAQAGTTPDALRKELESRGIRVLELEACKAFDNYVFAGSQYFKTTEPVPTGRRGPIFYAYDEKALREVLSSHTARATLDRARWPHTPSAFIERQHRESAAVKTPLFDLISDCYGSKEHNGRTDIHALLPSQLSTQQLMAEPVPVEHLPMRDVIREGYGPFDGNTHLNMLHHTNLSDESAQHFNTQYEVMTGQHEGDWRERHARRRTAPEGHDTPPTQGSGALKR